VLLTPGTDDEFSHGKAFYFIFNLNHPHTHVTVNFIPPAHRAYACLQSTMYARYGQIIYNVIYFVPKTYSVAKQQNILAANRKEGKV
jgi:hypothetical protein